MKGLLLTLSFVFFMVITAFAQRVQYGLEGGLGFASQSINNPDVLSTNSITTLNIHITADVPLKHQFYLQAGLGLLGKGVKEYRDAQTNTITFTYLDIPITLLYKFNLPTLGKLYLGGGPYLSMGLSGNNQLETVSSSTGNNVEFGNDADFKKMDYGVNFTTGLELNNHLTFNMKYSLGLNNIASNDPDDNDPNTVSRKNRIFTIGIGFWL